MTPEKIKNIYECFVDHLLKINLAVQKNSFSIISFEDGQLIYSPPSTHLDFSLIKNKFGTAFEYLKFLEITDYSCVLNDGSIIQMSCKVVAGEVTDQRLLYHPCPVEISLQDYYDKELLDTVKAALDNFKLTMGTEEDLLRMKSPIRFDYSATKATRKKYHAFSHAHINDSESRISIHGPVNINSFGKYLCRYFYPEYFEEYTKVKYLPDYIDLRTITTEEEKTLFLEEKK